MTDRRPGLTYAIIFAVIAVTFVLSHSANAQAQPPAVTPAASPEIHAVLEKIIHPKKAKVGDTVTARVTDNAKLKDGTEVPKGSHLVGTVTELKEKADKEGPAKIGLLFDKAQIKGGKDVPLSLALVSVAPRWEPGGVDSVAADNKMASTGRVDELSASSGQASGNPGDTTLSKGLGIRKGGVNTDPAAMQPGVSYIEGVNITSYAVTTPGTVLEAPKGSFYVDSGTRLLFLVQ